MNCRLEELERLEFLADAIYHQILGGIPQCSLTNKEFTALVDKLHSEIKILDDDLSYILDCLDEFLYENTDMYAETCVILIENYMSDLRKQVEEDIALDELAQLARARGIVESFVLSFDTIVSDIKTRVENLKEGTSLFLMSPEEILDNYQTSSLKGVLKRLSYLGYRFKYDKEGLKVFLV